MSTKSDENEPADETVNVQFGGFEMTGSIATVTINIDINELMVEIEKRIVKQITEQLTDANKRGWS